MFVFDIVFISLPFCCQYQISLEQRVLLFVFYHYHGCVYVSPIQSDKLKFRSNVLVYVSVFVFSFPHVFVLRRNMQSDLCRDYHGLSMCIRGGRPLWHPANVTSRCDAWSR